MLNFYRPPYDDELLYGWITALADMNFPMDTAGIRRVIDCLFPFSKPPQKRGVIVKDPVRKDYIRGLDMNVRRMQEQGYKVPSADVLLRCSTPYRIASETGTVPADLAPPFRGKGLRSPWEISYPYKQERTAGTARRKNKTPGP